MAKSTKAVPRTRFAGFRDEWSSRKLKDVAAIKGRIGFRGYTVSDLVPAGEGALTIGAKHIGPAGRLNLAEPTYLSWDKYHESPEIMIQPGDILFVQRGSLGMTAMVDEVPEPATINPSMVIIRVSDADPEFIYQTLSGPIVQKEVEQISTATAVPMISQGQIGSFAIALPTLPEQQKIAAFLGAVDRKIQQLKRKQELLERYKQGVVQQLFSQELRFKKKDGGEYPEWEERELSSITKRVTGKNTDMKVETVLTNSATQGIVSQRDYFDKDIANASNIGGYYVVRKDDFVYNPRISATAPVGPIKRNHLDTGIMSPLYTVFRFTETDIDFFECFFESNAWHDHMRSVANYGARHDRMNITMDDLFSLPVPFPCEEERKKIASFLMALDAKVAGVAQAVAAAEKWKKGLLQQMFV